MKIVFISDTHTRHDFAIPEGDLLVHCGDLTFTGAAVDLVREAKWLQGIKIGHGFQEVVIIAGNHDWLAEQNPGLTKSIFTEHSCLYLHHEPAEIEGIKFFGSGYTPFFMNWALNVRRGPDLARLWSQIPDDTQILVTHGPPWGIGDRTLGYENVLPYGIEYEPPRHVGCHDLLRRIEQLNDLKIHACGHIHSGYGVHKTDKVTYLNCSTVNENYKAVNSPLVIDWPMKNA